MSVPYPCEDPSPPVAQRETCAIGPVLQSTTAEPTVYLLTSALLILWGWACVSQGLAREQPKQIPGEDELANTLIWKGLWIYGCCSNVVPSSAPLIIYTWTYSCTLWFACDIHQFLQIPFPKPSAAHRHVTEVVKNVSDFYLNGISLESPLIFFFWWMVCLVFFFPRVLCFVVGDFEGLVWVLVVCCFGFC